MIQLAQTLLYEFYLVNFSANGREIGKNSNFRNQFWPFLLLDNSTNWFHRKISKCPKKSWGKNLQTFTLCMRAFLTKISCVKGTFLIESWFHEFFLLYKCIYIRLWFSIRKIDGAFAEIWRIHMYVLKKSNEKYWDLQELL